MAFPANPENGDIHVQDGRTYRFVSVIPAWLLGGPPTPPEPPEPPEPPVPPIWPPRPPVRPEPPIWPPQPPPGPWPPMPVPPTWPYPPTWPPPPPAIPWPNGDVDMRRFRIVNMHDAHDPQDAVTARQVQRWIRDALSDRPTPPEPPPPTDETKWNSGLKWNGGDSWL